MRTIIAEVIINRVSKRLNQNDFLISSQKNLHPLRLVLDVWFPLQASMKKESFYP